MTEQAATRPGPGFVAYMARFGITPLDIDGNELHARLWDALRDVKGVSATEMLVLVLGALSAAHEDAATAMGAAQAKYETTLETVQAQAVEEGRSAQAAVILAKAAAREHRNEFLAAQAWWRSVKQYIRTVEKDFDRARSDQADARQGNHVASYGGGVQ